MNPLEQQPDSKIQRARLLLLSFFPEREALEALVTETQRDVTGAVRLTYKGNIIVAGRNSAKSLSIQTCRFAALLKAIRQLRSK